MAVPEAITRACPVCRKLTTNKSGYCDEHEKEYLERRDLYRARYDMRRGSPASRGYDRTWATVRKTYLSQHPLCEQCEKEGRVRPAKEVHHIKALQDGGERLNPDNFMAVCRECHRKFTEAEIRARKGLAPK